ncbi:MAG TPA: cytochrome c3 family protein [Candidatus Sulfotelmatobacter sp.]|jgi:predicted CXXCH cytochrome family protein|nr:cytochrome c3 family protein [Candidatus Sulfotelmatobacter sp.]
MKTIFPFLCRPAWRWLMLALLTVFSLNVSADSVINSVHNLSANGPGTIKATSMTNSCIFCHAVHHASGVTPLWNHSMSSVSNYVVYSSTRLNNMNLVIPQPNGSSRLCLSCHDGTIALGSVSSGAPQIPMQNGVTTMPGGSAANLGTDLSADHPISFVYDSALATAARDPDSADPSLSAVYDPTKLSTPAVKVDSQSRLQCTSCHDPHNNQYGNFLVVPTASELCVVCHRENSWGTSAHAMSQTPVPPSILSKLAATSRPGSKASSSTVSSKTMQAVGCEACHITHQAGAKKHLLQQAAPEQNCLNCHNGATAKKDIAADFQKISIHPITLSSDAHSPDEDPINPQVRHVVCADCHNAHADNAQKAAAPNATGALAGLTGVTIAGTVIKPLTKEYELCFRCHADSSARGPALVSRQFPQNNTRLQFASANQSFHPVETIGKNQASVPSLIEPWKTTSVMYCTDCHNSDSSPAAGGSGPNGPHGSIYRPILERNLDLLDNQPESTSAYALCYKCHDRNVVLSNQSFRYHESHVVNDKAACTTCHDSHGVANAPHLINFNTTYVTPGSLGTVRYQSTGNFKGTCTLMCHGYDHKNTSY